MNGDHDHDDIDDCFPALPSEPDQTDKNGKPMFGCPVCGRKYVRRQKLVSHANFAHKYLVQDASLHLEPAALTTNVCDAFDEHLMRSATERFRAKQDVPRQSNFQARAAVFSKAFPRDDIYALSLNLAGLTTPERAKVINLLGRSGTLYEHKGAVGVGYATPESGKIAVLDAKTLTADPGREPLPVKTVISGAFGPRLKSRGRGISNVVLAKSQINMLMASEGCNLDDV